MRCRFISGSARFRTVARGEHRAILREQREAPIPVAADEGRTWWMFRERVYWEDESLEADDVMALLLERERRRRRRLDRARDLMAAEGDGARREPIPEDVRREVFRRDGGHCVVCGSAELLQFDHVIPVALGGNSSPDNLQLLCSTCNREKGASL